LPGVTRCDPCRRTPDLGKWNISCSKGNHTEVCNWLDTHLVNLWKTIQAKDDLPTIGPFPTHNVSPKVAESTLPHPWPPALPTLRPSLTIFANWSFTYRHRLSPLKAHEIHGTRICHLKTLPTHLMLRNSHSSSPMTRLRKVQQPPHKNPTPLSPLQRPPSAEGLVYTVKSSIYEYEKNNKWAALTNTLNP
jgi:hypothetical protein